MSFIRANLPLTQACIRCLNTSAIRYGSCPKLPIEKPSSAFKRLKELQKKFQVENGVPIYLKAGFRDKILYQATWALTGIGLVMTVHCWVVLILRV